MSELAINSRKATRDNLAAIISLLADDDIGQSREVISEPPDVRYVDASDAINRDEDQLLVVAEESNVVLGCLQLTFIPGLSRTGIWRGQIESVRTARSKRGSGLGRKTFEYAIEECPARGCGLVQLTSDKGRHHAIRLYEGLGFEDSHEGMKLKF